MIKKILMVLLFVELASTANAVTKRVQAYDTLAAPAAGDWLFLSDVSDSGREYKIPISAIYGSAITSGLSPVFAGVDLGVASTTTGLMRFFGNTKAFSFGLFSQGADGPGIGWRLPSTPPAGTYIVTVDTNGYMAYLDPSTISGSVSDVAYDATTWDGVTTVPPSKNALRDYLESRLPTGSDGTRRLIITDNPGGIAPTGSAYEIYPDAGVWKLNDNGVEAVILHDQGTQTVNGIVQADVSFNSYTAAQTLTEAAHNSGVVQMTTADEVTMWDCETANIGNTVLLWARDAEKIEVVPASGDHFNLFAGTALTANNELDIAATAGTKATLMCTADDTWSVFHETAASTDGGAAD